jgi:predicted O-methyltransferase YrrM
LTVEPSSVGGSLGLDRRFRQSWEERKLARQIARRGKWYEPFHGDEVLQNLVDEIISRWGVTTFVETGTFVADTTKYVATNHPQVRVLTCEINPRWTKIAKQFCQGIENIEFFNGSSIAFLEKACERLQSSKTLFWLDAHWGENWPLFEETKIISSLPTYAVIIDDFEVPGRPDFPFESYHGTKNCFAVHKSVMGEVCLVPDYDPSPGCRPAGYGIFFKNTDYAELETTAKLRRLSS